PRGVPDGALGGCGDLRGELLGGKVEHPAQTRAEEADTFPRAPDDQVQLRVSALQLPTDWLVQVHRPDELTHTNGTLFGVPLPEPDRHLPAVVGTAQGT